MGPMGRQEVSNVIRRWDTGWEVSEDELWVCGRCVCAVYSSRCVSICDSYEKPLGSGCWVGGWGQRSLAGAEQR